MLAIVSLNEMPSLKSFIIIILVIAALPFFNYIKLGLIFSILTIILRLPSGGPFKLN
jgi:hypothetical protein